MRILKITRDAATLKTISAEYIEYSDIPETLETLGKTGAKLGRRSVESWLDAGKTFYVNDAGTIREYRYTN